MRPLCLPSVLGEKGNEGYIVQNGEIWDLPRLERLFAIIGAQEQDILKNREEEAVAYNAKRRKFKDAAPMASEEEMEEAEEERQRAFEEAVQEALFGASVAQASVAEEETKETLVVVDEDEFLNGEFISAVKKSRVQTKPSVAPVEGTCDWRLDRCFPWLLLPPNPALSADVTTAILTSFHLVCILYIGLDCCRRQGLPGEVLLRKIQSPARYAAERHVFPKTPGIVSPGPHVVFGVLRQGVHLVDVVLPLPLRSHAARHDRSAGGLPTHPVRHRPAISTIPAAAGMPAAPVQSPAAPHLPVLDGQRRLAHPGVLPARLRHRPGRQEEPVGGRGAAGLHRRAAAHGGGGAVLPRGTALYGGKGPQHLRKGTVCMSGCMYVGLLSYPTHTTHCHITSPCLPL